MKLLSANKGNYLLNSLMYKPLLYQRKKCDPIRDTALSLLDYLLFIYAQFSDHICRDHCTCQQNNCNPAFDSKRNTAEHFSNPLERGQRNDRRIYEQCLHDYNNQKYFNKIFILIQTGKNCKSIVTHIKAVEQSCHNKQYKITRQVLFLICKQIYKERHFQEAADRMRLHLEESLQFALEALDSMAE